MTNQRRGAFLAIAGTAILSSAVLHGLVNVPHLREDLLEIGVRATLISAVSLVLYFSVVAMLAFGGLVMNAALQAFRGRPPEVGPLWVVACCYLVFGLAGFVLMGQSPHLLGYAAMGVVVGFGTALQASDRRPREGGTAGPRKV